MTASPQISVVMSVYNGASHVAASIDSILSQTFEDFEFIVVNDGSTDGTADVLNDYAARDSRIRLITQENSGLTGALIQACSKAKGEFIARQDAADISLQSRLGTQLQSLVMTASAVMVGAGVDYITPSGEVLFTRSMPGKSLDDGLRELSISRLKGPPHHGATMYRRDAYLTCGGYRRQFRVAQDIDLWLRLSERGECLGNAEVLYRAVIEPESISIIRRPDQLYFARIAIESAKRRRSCRDDSDLFVALDPPSSRRSGRKPARKADYFYFIGCVLMNSDRDASLSYLTRALEINPFHLKARVKRMIAARN